MDHKSINPSISKEEFESLGFRQWRYKDDGEGGTWSVGYHKQIISPESEKEWIDITWFCGTSRYEIKRDTQYIKNISLFEGFIKDVEQFKMLFSMFDISPEYLKNFQVENKMNGFKI